MSKTRFVFSGILGTLMLCCLSAGSLWAQSVTVKGTVRSGDKKEPLPQAKVYAPADGTGVLTGMDGTYTIKMKQSDTLRLEISYTELKTEQIKIVYVPGTQTYTRDALLKEVETTVGDVIITASKTEQKAEELPVSYTLIKPKTVDLQGSANIQSSIENTPGITIQDDQVNIRSTSGYAYGVGSRVILALNGMPILSANATTAEFDLIPTDNIRQVEIIKGASSVLYGSSALGGVINVIMDDPGDKPFTSFRVRGSVYDHPRNQALDWDGRSAPYEGDIHFFHARKLSPSFALTLQTDLLKESGYRQGEESEQARLKVLTKWSPQKIKGFSVGLNAAYNIDSSGAFLFWNGYYPDTTVVITPGALPLTFDTNMVVTGGALTPAAGTLRKQLNKRVSVDPSISYLTNKGQLHVLRGRVLGGYFTNNSNQSNYSTLYYGEYQFNTPLFTKKEKFKLNLVSGLNVIRSDVNSDSLFGQHYITQQAAYAQFNSKVGVRLNLSLGGRFQRNITDGDSVSSAPLMSVGANYQIAAGTHVRASYGQAFRSPSVAERFTATSAGGLPVLPNPGLRDEKGWSSEIGIQQGFKFADNWKGFVDLAAFRMKYNDMIEYGVKRTPPGSSFPLGFGPGNVSAAQIDGFEVSAMGGGKVGPLGVSFSGGYTYTNPIDLNYNPDSTYNIDNPSTWTFPDRPEILKYRFKELVRGTVTLEYKRVAFTTFFRYNSHMISIDQQLMGLLPGIREFRDMHNQGARVWDFVLAYNLENSIISGHVQNAFNEEYTMVPWILAKQRQYVLQWKYTFTGRTAEERRAARNGGASLEG